MTTDPAAVMQAAQRAPTAVCGPSKTYRHRTPMASATELPTDDTHTALL